MPAAPPWPLPPSCSALEPGGGGGTLEQRKALATDFDSCGEQAHLLADEALAAAPPALELQAINMEGTGLKKGG